MKKTTAPLAARILAIASLALGLLWVIGYFVCVVFQRDIRIALNYPDETINFFRVPVAPLVTNGLLILLQSIVAVLLIVFWKKAVWSRGAAIALIVSETALVVLQGVFGSVISSAETVWIGQYIGYTALSAMSSVTQSLSLIGGFASLGSLLMLTALSLLAYRAGLDRQLQKNGGVLA